MKRILCLLLVLLLTASLAGCIIEVVEVYPTATQAESSPFPGLEDIPAYAGEPYVVIHNNEPDFGAADYTTNSFESYSPLDELGRCGVAYACLGRDLMPTEERGSISSVKPSGWHSAQYSFVDGKSLYNRCHLIGFQLAGENANSKNLITGTRYLNVIGMLPFENLVCDYIKETGNHVLYRVVPLYDGDNLVADGVTMEGWSVEDEGDGICFAVFCYNVQPGVKINYATGESTVQTVTKDSPLAFYIINTKTKKFHAPDCGLAEGISKKNRDSAFCNRQELLDKGYNACQLCRP